MRERPILFSSPMVTAILEGRKTMTRRVAKYDHFVLRRMQGGYDFETFMRINPAYLAIPEVYESCPYGKPGDRLWVRERMRAVEIDRAPLAIRVRYEADGTESQWLKYPERLKGKPDVGKCLAYGGFREASRITLEITGVRVERLQDMSEESARAEGFEGQECPHELGRPHGFCTDCLNSGWLEPPTMNFMDFWDKINGKKHPWASNPWVWVVEFKNI